MIEASPKQGQSPAGGFRSKQEFNDQSQQNCWDIKSQQEHLYEIPD
jgi:hypothetical protein